MLKESSQEFENEKQKDVKRPYILVFIGLLVLFGLFFWALHFERPVIVPSGNAPNGHSSQANGSGAGDNGDAQGFGEDDNAGTQAGSKDSAGVGDDEISDEKNGDSSSNVAQSIPLVNTTRNQVDSAPTNDKWTVKGVKTKEELKPRHILGSTNPVKVAKNNTAKTTTNTDYMASYGKNSGGRGGAGIEGFYGIKHYGNTLFIVDISGSMRAKTREGISRIDIMRSQLRNVINFAARKHEKKKYSIITFASEINRFPNKGKIQTYFDNINTQKDAEIFIKKMSPDGGTYMMAAWEEVMKLVHNNEVKIDTIFFLSDGEPSDCNGSDLIKFIKEHVSTEITINTIAIGLSSSFMKELAQIYSGTYLCVE